MPTAHLNLQPGEYVVLTHPFLGLPAGSVGRIIKRSSPRWHRYLVYFGESLPRGPFPETMLMRLEMARMLG